MFLCTKEKHKEAINDEKLKLHLNKNIAILITFKAIISRC